MGKPCCKVCGYEIVPGGRLPDLDAQDHGFCGAGCQEVHEAIKASDFKQAANG